MKITYVLPVYWPAIGGCEVHTRELVKRVASRHEVKVITQVNSQKQKLKARKGKTANLWTATTIWAPSKKRIYFDNNAEVQRLGLNLFEKLPAYAAVRYHSYAEQLTMKILTTIFKKKLLSLTEEADLIHCIHGGVSYLGLTALQIARKKRIPFVYTPVAHLFNRPNRSEEPLQLNNSSFISRRVFIPTSWLDKFWFDICKQADSLITMTKYEKAFFQENAINPEKIFPVGIGPVLSAKGNGNDFRKKYGIEKNKIILFLGRKHESKGVFELMGATRYVWQKNPEAHFFFIGPTEGKTKSLFKKYQDKRIKEIGFVDEQEKANALEACDIFCLPSHEESLGGVYLEAWMYEKPIIALDIPPLQELTDNGKGGGLVYPHPKSIAEKINQLVEDENLCKKMGAWGKNNVIANYSWERIVDKVEKIYQDLI
jgi:glycosyltransferase involved in cell wall biosynthesis